MSLLQFYSSYEEAIGRKPENRLNSSRKIHIFTLRSIMAMLIAVARLSFFIFYPFLRIIALFGLLIYFFYFIEIDFSTFLLSLLLIIWGFNGVEYEYHEVPHNRYKQEIQPGKIVLLIPFRIV